jgi:Fic family protein
LATQLQRSFAASHSWLTFRVDLRGAGADFWLLLGEARSKVERLAGSLLKPDVAARMHAIFLAKGAQATTAIEGNTLSEDDALEIVEGGTLDLPPSQEYLAIEIQNIVDACNRVKDELVAGASADLTVDGIKQFNREVLHGLELDAGIIPGEIRTHSVLVGGRYRGAPAEDCEYLLGRLCEWLNGPEFDAKDDARQIPWALIKAAVAHLYLAWIHPFGDGNGRTARLVEFQILLAAGIPLPAAHLLSSHYNVTRTEYYRQLAHSSESGGDLIPFLHYAVRGFVDGIRAQLEEVRLQQWGDRWEQFIYETFGPVTSRARERRRELILQMSRETEPIPRSRLPMLTPHLAQAYAGTERTLSRDLNALKSMGLIERVPAGWKPKRELILAFLPVRRREPIEQS